MIGALVGDAAGATLEFCRKNITEEMALQAMTMPGGGVIGVGPGQITDDGELTLALWRALNSDEAHPLIKAYSDWYESCPFDIGRTCSLAFGTFYDYSKGRNVFSVEGSKDIIKKINELSEANGALMRATAIATWAIKDLYTGIKMAREDALMSHPSIVCQEVNIIYVATIILLLNGKTPQETLKLINNFVSTQITSEKVKKW
jgi:ADP-ribosylglycohydrolase